MHSILSSQYRSTTPWRNMCGSAQLASQPLSDCVWRGRPTQTKTKSMGATRAGAALCLETQLLAAPFVVLKLSTASAFSPSQDHLTVIIFVLGGRPCHKKGWREGWGFGEYLSRLSLGGALPCGPEAVDCERFFSKCLSPLGQIISQVLGTRGRSGIQKSTLIFPGG